MAHYPWDQCIRDQKQRYGSQERAEKVCGMIRSKYGMGGKALIDLTVHAGDVTDIILPDDFDLEAALKMIEAELQLSPLAQTLGAIAAADQQAQAMPGLMALGKFNLQDGLAALGGAVKALNDTGLIEMPLALFGDAAHKDLTGQYFMKDTNFHWDGKESRPHLYHHGLDPELGLRFLGDGLHEPRLDEFALWAKSQLNLSDRYEAFLFMQAKAGKLGCSSGTAPHMIKAAADGRILEWPIVEGSSTFAPIEPRTRGLVQPIKSLTIVTPLKALIDSGSAGVASIGATSSPARPDAGRKIFAFRRNKRNLKSTGAQSMNKQQILDLITKFAPKVSPDDADKIAELLAIALGLNDAAPDQPPPADGGGAMAPEMMKALTEALKAMGLTPQTPPDPKAGDQALQDQILAALKALGIQPVQPTSKADPVTRPPFTFKPKDKPDDDDPNAAGLKALTLLRFGETEPAVKAIATDLYGADYEQKRYEQHVAFGRYLRGGERLLDANQHRALKVIILTPKQLKAAAIEGIPVSYLKADLSEVIDNLGGFTVPEDWRTDMLERLPGLTVVRRRADVSPTSSDVMSKIKLTGGDKRHQSAMRVTWVGDTPAANQAVTNPTFGVEKTPIHIAKLTVRVPMALLEDSAVNLSSKLGEWSQNEFAVDEDEQFLIGNGIAKPQGILPGGVNGLSLTHVASGAAGGFPIDETQADCLMALKYAVPRQHRANAIWTMNDTTVGLVSKLKDTTGQFLWHESLRAGEPATLFGYPVETSEAMPDVAASAFPIIFGDFGGYQIADRIGMTLIRDETTEAEQDIVKFMFRRRLGGQPAREWCFAVLEIAAS